jgi:hypothetical protein
MNTLTFFIETVKVTKPVKVCTEKLTEEILVGFFCIVTYHTLKVYPKCIIVLREYIAYGIKQFFKPRN